MSIITLAVTQRSRPESSAVLDSLPWYLRRGVPSLLCSSVRRDRVYYRDKTRWESHTVGIPISSTRSWTCFCETLISAPGCFHSQAIRRPSIFLPSWHFILSVVLISFLAIISFRLNRDRSKTLLLLLSRNTHYECIIVCNCEKLLPPEKAVGKNFK